MERFGGAVAVVLETVGDSAGEKKGKEGAVLPVNQACDVEVFVFGDEYVVGLEIGMSEGWASQGGIAVGDDMRYSLEVFFEILYMFRG